MATSATATMAVRKNITLNEARMSSRVSTSRWMTKVELANSRTDNAMPRIAIPMTDTPISLGVRMRDTAAATAKLLAKVKYRSAVLMSSARLTAVMRVPFFVAARDCEPDDPA